MAKRKPPPPPPKVAPTPSTEIDLTGSHTAQQVIFSAMMVYIDTPGLGLRELWQTRRINPEDDASAYFQDLVSWYALERAAIKGKWSKRREAHWREVERRVLNALQTTHVERELEELKQLEGVESVLLGHITGVTDEHGNIVIHPARPKSLEGTVGALVNLAKYRDGKRERINDDIAERASAPAEADGRVITVEATVEDNLSEADIEAMALALAEKRAGMLEDHGDGSNGEE